MAKLFEELKRRKVFRVAAVYAVVAWVLIQVSDVVLPTFEAPAWVNQTIIFLFILGFVPTLIAAWAYEITPEGIKADTLSHTDGASTNNIDRKLIYATFALVLLVAGFQVADRFLIDSGREAGSTRNSSYQDLDPGSIRANLLLGESRADADTGMHGFLALSPDGRFLAFTKNLGSGGVRISIQNLQDGSSRILPETIIGRSVGPPAFSPDGERLLIGNSRAEIFSISVNGSGIQPIASDNSPPGSYAWVSNQSVIYKPQGQSVFHKISIFGGESEALQLPANDQDTLLWPSAIPDTSWIVYTRRSTTSDVQLRIVSRIEAFNLETKEVKALVNPGSNARYAPSGHLVFMREGDLWAAPLNRQTMELSGGEVLIESGIEHHSFRGLASYTFSDNGRLLYRSGLDAGSAGVVGLELTGSSGESIAHSIPANALQARFSPDHSRLVFTLPESDSPAAATQSGAIRTDIAVYDIAEQIVTRRTFSGNADRPLWSPDGAQIVYRTRDDDGFSLWMINSDGSGQPEQLLTAPLSISATSFSPDGLHLIFSQGGGNSSEVKMLSLEEIENPIRDLFPASENQDAAEISSDGNWIVYGSDELGGRRVFVRPFPDLEGGKWMVSNIEGREAHWGPDGTLYFQENLGSIYRVPVDTQNGFRAGRAELMFEGFYRPGLEPNFDVSQDGQQVIYTRTERPPVIESDALILVENWFDRLRNLAPSN